MAISETMASHPSALVLAAGFGSRLAPLTDEIAKPLVPIGNRPLLERVLCALHDDGFSSLAVNAHYRADEIAAVVAGLPFAVHVFREDVILGTAGGAKQVAQQLGCRELWIRNGDIHGRLPTAELRGAGEPGLVLALVPRPVLAGTVGVGRSGQVVRLRGERFGEEVTSGDYMGTARLGPDCLSTLPDTGCLVGDWALPRLRTGTTIGTVYVEAPFIDIGTLDQYLAANLVEVDRLGRSIVAGEASIDGHVRVFRSVVGAGARVTGDGAVEECVVLPGAFARAPLRRAIVTPSGRVLQA